MIHFILRIFTLSLLYSISWKKKIYLANCKHLGLENQYFTTLKNLSREISEIILPRPFPVLENHSLKTSIPKAFLLTAHLGNHELLAKYLLNNKIKLRAFYQKSKSERFNSFLKKRRFHNGTNYAPYHGKVWKTLVKDLHKDFFWFAYLWDQDPNKHPRLSGIFFNKEIHSHQFMETLWHNNPESPVFFATLIFNPLHKYYEFQINQKEDNEDIHSFYLKNLEKTIQDNPTFWFGLFHRRFKSTSLDIYNQ